MAAPPETINLADLQGLVVFRRPAPYWGTQLLFRIDHTRRGRDLLARLLPSLTSAADWASGQRDLVVAIALTHPGLAMLGVPPESLASFPVQLRDGMAARAGRLGDVADSAPARWDAPLGRTELHAVVSVTAASQARRTEAVTAVLTQVGRAGGVTLLARCDVAALPGTRTTFGYRDGISFPNIAGLPPSPMSSPEPPLATGEFLLGHPSENGAVLAMPTPDILGRNGSYIGIRKLHTRVAAFRRFLHANAADSAGEELLAAKMLGRWRSGAPLMLASTADDPPLAGDPARVNAFTYANDSQGLICPHGAHIRRLNPRDSKLSTMTDVRIHRILRYGAVYGPPLPDGTLDDDGAERGIYFMFLSARPDALEFLKSQWVNNGSFIGADDEKDPIAGDHSPGHDTYTLPGRPLRRRLHGLERFTVTKGGEYAFLPSLTALRWLTTQPPT
jgi:Dyp-type peroxidase family